MTTSWVDLPREETAKNRLGSVEIGNEVTMINLDYGINIYRNAIRKDECVTIIEDLENEISLGIRGISWSGAQVNERQSDDEVRNCVDLKYKRESLGDILPFSQTLFDIHTMVENRLDYCLRHYENLWNLKMHYKEAFNFVKYSPGKYFKIHGDHGPYYACTVSAVAYLNDNYDGGEIEFTRHGLVVKPEAGDIVIFPSNFVYEHASLQVFSGTKYSVVIMMDYNDLHHKGYI